MIDSPLDAADSYCICSLLWVLDLQASSCCQNVGCVHLPVGTTRTPSFRRRPRARTTRTSAISRCCTSALQRGWSPAWVPLWGRTTPPSPQRYSSPAVVKSVTRGKISMYKPQSSKVSRVGKSACIRKLNTPERMICTKAPLKSTPRDVSRAHAGRHLSQSTRVRTMPPSEQELLAHCGRWCHSGPHLSRC